LRYDNTETNGQDSSKIVYYRLDFGKAYGNSLLDSLGGGYLICKAIFDDYPLNIQQFGKKSKQK
jgi:hypothetical protein